METTTRVPVAIRALGVDDLDTVVVIDAEQRGRSRRVYIERRVQAALREPTLHAQLAAVDDRGLAGFMLGRVLEGEFGLSDTALRLELLGVRADARGRGAGTQLFDALLQWARRHGVHELHTAASWRDTRLLHWLADMGFELAPTTIVERAVEHAADGKQPLPETPGRCAREGRRPRPRDRLRDARRATISSASRAAMPTCAPWCRPTWATSCASTVASPVASAAATSAGA